MKKRFTGNPLIVGLNPSWQRIIQVKNWVAGEVHRCSQVDALASGKGINSAFVLNKLGLKSSVLQFVGGYHGDCIKADLKKWAIESINIKTQNNSRICTTLLNKKTGETTEFIDPFSVESKNWNKQILKELLPMAWKKKHQPVMICGTAPSGVSEDIFKKILDHFISPIVFLDGYKGLDAELLSRVKCLKVNRTEFKELIQNKWFKKLAHHQWPEIFLTDGPKKAWSLHANSKKAFCYELPNIKNIINPIGAGDSVTSGLVYYYGQGLSEKESFSRALSIGMASCLELLPSRFDQGIAESLNQKN